jgi:hypothetical protein
MKTVSVDKVDDFKAYPTNRVCGIIGNSMDARSTLDALLRGGISEKDIDIFHGMPSDNGKEPGLKDKIAEILRSFGDIDNELMRQYQVAMEHGGYIFEVHSHSDEEKENIEHILLRNGAHEINYFGTWYVEAMHER